jgi:HAD superfamily hydrolase (TIGR01509 family)
MTHLHSPDLTNPAPASPDDPKPAALLIDCDGTLLLTGDLHFTAISEAVLLQGGQMPRDWYIALTGLGRDDLFARFQAEHGVALDMPKASADSIDRTVQHAAKARENPSVVAVARAARGRVPLAVVTNSEARIANAFLAATGLRDMFEQVITREDAHDPKPAPELYLTAAARLGVRPADCLVLEDSAEGLCAAEKAGMRAYDVRKPEWQMQSSHLLQRLTLVPER